MDKNEILEEAIRICEVLHKEAMDMGESYILEHGRGSLFIDGQALGAKNCAYRIKQLKEETTNVDTKV